MNKLEEILNSSAKKNMTQWDLSSFKKTHPSLFITIIEAMEESGGPEKVYKKHRCRCEKDKDGHCCNLLCENFYP